MLPIPKKFNESVYDKDDQINYYLNNEMKNLIAEDNK